LVGECEGGCGVCRGHGKQLRQQHAGEHPGAAVAVPDVAAVAWRPKVNGVVKKKLEESLGVGRSIRRDHCYRK
jgi:hypothetical protein